MDLHNLTIEQMQKIMDDEKDFSRCISIEYIGTNTFDETIPKYRMKWFDEIDAEEIEDSIMIFTRDDGSHWIRY